MFEISCLCVSASFKTFRIPILTFPGMISNLLWNHNSDSSRDIFVCSLIVSKINGVENDIGTYWGPWRLLDERQPWKFMILTHSTKTSARESSTRLYHQRLSRYLWGCAKNSSTLNSRVWKQKLLCKHVRLINSKVCFDNAPAAKRCCSASVRYSAPAWSLQMSGAEQGTGNRVKSSCGYWFALTEGLGNNTRGNNRENT